MKQVLSLYRNAYGGLSEAAWMLALIMFINRSGSMVLPFLSIYVTGHLGYSIEEAGIILGMFGLGSMIGSFSGGWLTDKIGHFPVQFFSLIIGGSLFFFLPGLTEFKALAAGIFITSTIIECLRPANASSVALYSKPENVTRSFSLNRMAINLGFSVGPAVGGLLASISYKLLFVADGVSCILAGVFFFFYFRHKKTNKPAGETRPKLSAITASPYRDLPFMLFVFLCFCFAVVFLQLINTLPLYYREIHHLREYEIGILLALNGFIVFALEMILVYLLEKRFRLWQIIVTGSLLNGLAFIVLNLVDHPAILYIAMIFLSLAEILAMPFMVGFIVKRAEEHNRGAYMGLYAFSFAAAFVTAPYVGTQIISHYGFTTLWWLMGAFSIITAVAFYAVILKMSVREAKALNQEVKVL